jgi:integrase
MKIKAKTAKKGTKLDAFFDDLGNKSQSTISGYNTAIWQFVRYIYNLTDSEKGQCAEYVEQYFSESRNYHADFKKFIKDTLGNRPGLSALQMFNQIKKFLELCDVTFTKKEISQLKNQLPSGGVLTQEADLDTDTIRAILQHTDVKGKAIILCLATGGMRIGELLQVQCDDVDLKSVPAVIQIRAKTEHGRTKTGQQRYTFVSSEAVAAVKEWIKIRPAYLKAVSEKANHLKNVTGPKDANDGRLFPMSDNSVNELFRGAITAVFGKNELDKNTGRSTRHVHQLRKFFISSLSLVTSESVADFFAGHKSALSDNYRRYTQKQMAEYYLKGEHMLYIEAPLELREMGNSMKKEMAVLKDETLKNNSLMIGLLAKNNELNDALKQQQKEIDTSSRRNDELEDSLARIKQEMARQKEIELTLENHPLFTEIKKALPEMIEAELRRKMNS